MVYRVEKVHLSFTISAIRQTQSLFGEPKGSYWKVICTNHYAPVTGHFIFL